MNMIALAYPHVLRPLSSQQTNTGLVWLPPGMVISGYDQTGGPNSYTHRNGVRIQRYRMTNACGGDCHMGLGFRLDNRIWIAGRLSADGNTFTDITSSVQAPTAVAVQVAGADQTGFVVCSRVPFDWMSGTVSTAETNAGGSTVVDHTATYSLGATWSDPVTTAMTADWVTANAVWDVGVRNWVWPRSILWQPSASLGGVPDGYYCMRFTSVHREASDVAAVVTGIEIGTMPIIARDVPDGSIFAAESELVFEPLATGVVAYFSDDDVDNHLYVECDSFL